MSLSGLLYSCCFIFTAIPSFNVHTFVLVPSCIVFLARIYQPWINVLKGIPDNLFPPPYEHQACVYYGLKLCPL